MRVAITPIIESPYPGIVMVPKNISNHFLEYPKFFKNLYQPNRENFNYYKLRLEITLLFYIFVKSTSLLHSLFMFKIIKLFFLLKKVSFDIICSKAQIHLLLEEIDKKGGEATLCLYFDEKIYSYSNPRHHLHPTSQWSSFK